MYSIRDISSSVRDGMSEAALFSKTSLDFIMPGITVDTALKSRQNLRATWAGVKLFPSKRKENS
jgi:hypothetical protein